MSYDPLAQLRELAQCPPSLRRTGGLTPRGFHVRLLRRCLAAAGALRRPEYLDPATEVPDRYDEPLEAVVRRYRLDHGLGDSRDCDQSVWTQLAGGGAPWPVPTIPAKPAGREALLRREFLRRAAGEVGVRENGRNRGPQVERYLRQAEGHPGDAWCAAFCEAGLEWACEGLGLPVPFEVGLSCSLLVARAEKAGRIVSAAAAKPGDLLVVKGGPTGHKHVAIIEEIFAGAGGKPYARTIEGNTNAGGSANGDGVYRRQRLLSPKTCTIVNVCRA